MTRISCLRSFWPPLLFESAIHLRTHELRRDALPIVLFAVGGTLLSTVIVGLVVTWLLAIPLPYALVFGALISATDPISVVAVFKQLGAGRRLTLLIEAESLFNDGVAVVLFGVFLQAANGVHVSIAGGVGHFLVTVAGGVAVGAAVGFAATKTTQNFDDHLLELTLTTIVAFGSYLAAEACHVSGVVAVVAAGMVIGNYGMPVGMSASSRLAVVSFWEYAAFAVNSVVFLLVGISIAGADLLARAPVIVGASLAVLAGRAAVYPLSWLANGLLQARTRRGTARRPAPSGASSAAGAIPLPYQHVLFWGGLRGALSMALALGLGENFPFYHSIVAATFGVVLFSLVVQGVTIAPLLRRLNLTTAPHHQSRHGLIEAERAATVGALAELREQVQTGRLEAESAQALIARLDALALALRQREEPE